jgi:hypothetical protein
MTSVAASTARRGHGFSSTPGSLPQIGHDPVGHVHDQRVPFRREDSRLPDGPFQLQVHEQYHQHRGEEEPGPFQGPGHARGHVI